MVSASKDEGEEPREAGPSQGQQPRHEPGADGAAASTPQTPWPEPDFYRIHVVAQEGASAGSNVDSDGSAPVHTLEYGTIVLAYER